MRCPRATDSLRPMVAGVYALPMSRRAVSLAVLITLCTCATALAKPHVTIRWSRSGGIAGTSEVLPIRSDNVALAGPRGVNPYPAQLGAGQGAKLRGALEAAILAGSKRLFPAAGEVEAAHYRINSRGNVVKDQKLAVTQP